MNHYFHAYTIHFIFKYLSEGKNFKSPPCRVAEGIPLVNGHEKRFAFNYEIKNSLLNCQDIKNQDEFYTKIYDESMQKIGCTAPWLPGMKADICTNKQNSKEALKIYDDHFKNSNPCHILSPELTFESSFSPLLPGSTSVLLSCHKTFIRVYEEYLLYDELTLLANVGGFLGLSLGVSLVNIKDVLERCIKLFA